MNTQANALLPINEFIQEQLTPEICEKLKVRPAMIPWLHENFFERVVGDPAERRPGVMVGMRPGEGAAKLEILMKEFKAFYEWLEDGLSPHRRKRPISPASPAEQPPAQVPRGTEEVVVATIPPTPMDVVAVTSPSTPVIPGASPAPLIPVVTRHIVTPQIPQLPPRHPLRVPNIVVPKQPPRHNQGATPVVIPTTTLSPVGLPPPPTTPPPPPPVEAPAQNMSPDFPQRFHDVQLVEHNLPLLPGSIPQRDWPNCSKCLRIQLELRNLIHERLRPVRDPRHGIKCLELIKKLNERLRTKYRCTVGDNGEKPIRDLFESWGFECDQDRKGGTYMVNLMWKD